MVDTLNNLRDFASEEFETGNVTAIVVIAASDSIIREIAVPVGATVVGLQIANDGAVDFDEFKIQRRVNSLASYETIANVAADYSSPQFPILTVTGAPVTLSSLTVTDIEMNVEGTESIRILASGNAAASEATISWRFT